MIRSTPIPTSLPALALALLAGCATTASDPLADVPVALRPATPERVLQTLAARGVQIYECRSSSNQPAAWTFVAPEAELFGAQGYPVGRHYAGPHWESGDGSKLLGRVQASAAAPRAGAIPWLLLSATPSGASGEWAAVSHVLRVNTVGGVAPPAEQCDFTRLGTTVRVPYRADYVLLGA